MLQNEKNGKAMSAATARVQQTTRIGHASTGKREMVADHRGVDGYEQRKEGAALLRIESSEQKNGGFATR